MKHNDTQGPEMPIAEDLETLRSRPYPSKPPKVTAGTTFRLSGGGDVDFAAPSHGAHGELGTSSSYVKISGRPGPERKFWRSRF